MFKHFLCVVDFHDLVQDCVQWLEGEGIDVCGLREPTQNYLWQCNWDLSLSFLFLDLVQSIGVMIAAILIWVNPAYRAADPICTFLFSIVVVFTTVPIMRDTIRVLMEATPRGMDMDVIKSDLVCRIGPILGDKNILPSGPTLDTSTEQNTQKSIH